MIKSDSNWYQVIWYIHNKTIYSHTYTGTYDVRVQMLLPKRLLVHIWDEKHNLILLSYVSNIYSTYVI